MSHNRSVAVTTVQRSSSVYDPPDESALKEAHLNLMRAYVAIVNAAGQREALVPDQEGDDWKAEFFVFFRLVRGGLSTMAANRGAITCQPARP
jgi:hypothetical protein